MTQTPIDLAAIKAALKVCEGLDPVLGMTDDEILILKNAPKLVAEVEHWKKQAINTCKNAAHAVDMLNVAEAQRDRLAGALSDLLPTEDLVNTHLNVCECTCCGKTYTAAEANRRSDKCDAADCERANARAALAEVRNATTSGANDSSEKRDSDLLSKVIAIDERLQKALSTNPLPERELFNIELELRELCPEERDK